MEFPGEDEGIPVRASAWFGNVRTRKSQRKNLAGSGSRDEWLGVPKTPFKGGLGVYHH